MNRLFCYILIIALPLFFAGCQKSETQVWNSLPSEVKFTSVDLTGARSLAVMQTIDGEVVTRSVAEPGYRLCIMDEEGKAKIASFTLRISGNESNSAWQKIKKSLTLVPGSITPVSDNYLHLDEVVAVHKENLAEITYGAAEYTVISEFLIKLWGGYILRLSDGALFKSPFPSIAMHDFKSAHKRHFQVTPDGKTIVGVHPSMGLDLQNPLYFPVVMSDQGSSFKITSNSSDILGQFLQESRVWVPENERFVVFNPYATKTGAWSFDMNLQPRFLDYSEKLSSLIDRHFMFTYRGRCYIMESQCHESKNDELGYEYVTEIRVYQVVINGDTLDCFQDFTSTSREQFKFAADEGMSMIETDEGALFIGGGGSVYFEFSETPSITLREIPGEFGEFGEFDEFDSNGKAYIPEVDYIDSYDAFTGIRTKIPVQWDKTSVGSLVSAEINNTPGDYYVVKGVTRDATTIVALIEKSTGLVTITELTELGNPIVTSSYRLN